MGTGHQRTKRSRYGSAVDPAKPLLQPRDGVPEPIDDPEALATAVRKLATGHGPVAIDAERASGYRYGQRAYLVQLRRAGTGTILIDPIPFADLTSVNDAINDAEWVLHAASQDLPCLSELGMRPKRLFDTELAGRLAGIERVGLGTMVEQMLGFALEKGHSAADWSTRPLPHDWLTYAALDVELLIELREALIKELTNQGKLDWAHQEFAALTALEPAAPRAEPWRRTSGIHRVRTARGLARVRALWQTRDRIARRRDLAQGRVLPDSAIIAAAQADPTNERELLTLSVFSGRSQRRQATTWLTALAQARALPETDLPGPASTSDTPPPYRWADRDPAAAERLARAKDAVKLLAVEQQLPPENLLAPSIVRRISWEPPRTVDLDSVLESLTSLGAREWQTRLTGPALTAALTDR